MEVEGEFKEGKLDGKGKYFYKEKLKKKEILKMLNMRGKEYTIIKMEINMKGNFMTI